LGRLLGGLIGRENYLGTTLQSFGEPFGMESFVGKKVVVFSDAIVDGIDRKTMGRITERLKTISGEDKQHINRKNRTYWEGYLSSRLIFLANELLAFRDDSGALASRIITIEMKQSFYGREDKGLTEKLLAERSGILNLALAALDRALARDELIQPSSGRSMGEALGRLTSDISAFIQDKCQVGVDEQGLAQQFFDAWKPYCQDRGIPQGLNLSAFTAKLRAAAEGPIRESRPRSGGTSRPTLLHGIGLRKLQRLKPKPAP
jgi:phage/plasmid-associated DNA primase